ncbi:MAG: cob(I)yrinic acid a,c-diamide adenosyltransferase [bacterium]
MKNGYVQVYTGNGKGKTTAAFGLALRAAGAGLKVFIGQFLKQGDYSEIKALKKLSKFIAIQQFGSGYFIKKAPEQKDFKKALNGLSLLETAINSGEYDLVIMDEVNTAVELKLLDEKRLVDIIDKRPRHVEIVITGRNASPRILEIADLITEMKEVRHYFQKGVRSRKGIEK